MPYSAMNFELFFCALGLAIFMEGLFYTIFARKLPNLFLYMAEQNPSLLRRGGVIAILAGVAVIALARLN